MKAFLKSLVLPALLITLVPAALADVLYSNIPAALPSNVPSLGYQASQTSEFGGLIQFAGGNTSYSLGSATVAMSDWALASTPANAPTTDGTITTTGFYVPLTLNLYNADGSQIGSSTKDAFILFRPAGVPSCPSPYGDGYVGAGGSCYNGSLSTVTFDLTGITTPTDTIIYGLAFNTQSYGASPIGADGPYNSLNFGLSISDPSVGSNPLPGTAYLGSGTGTFHQDSGWAPYTGMIEFASPTPEPSSLMLLGTGLVGLAGIARRKFARA